MESRTLIFEQHEKIFIVMLTEGDYFDDIHSFWTNKEKAEQTARFLRHGYENAHVIEMPCDVPIDDKKGYEVIINVNSCIPNELFELRASRFTMEQVKDIYNIKDLYDQERVKQILQQHPELLNKIIIDELFPANAETANFDLDINLQDRLFKNNGNWTYRVAKNAKAIEPEIVARDTTAVKAYERALELRERVIEIFNNMPERKCAHCSNPITKKNMIILGYKLKGFQDVPINDPMEESNLFDHEYVYACSRKCFQVYREINSELFDWELEEFE